MENNIISAEFDQMREQISLLKEKLSEQTIINQKHILQAISNRVSKINRMKWVSVFGAIFAIVYCPITFYSFGFSWMFLVGTELMLVFCLGMTLWMHRGISIEAVSSENLISLGIKVQDLKRHYANWLVFSIPMIALWFGWWICEAAQTRIDPIPFITAGLIGGLIGGVVGYLRHRKIVKQISEIINHIKDLQEH